MSLPSKFVLLADPRTGSGSLLGILQTHPDLRILDEPFNHNFVNWEVGNEDYRARVDGKESLDATVDQIFSEYDGFKVSGYQLHGDEVGGLPRDIEEDLVSHLLRRPEVKIVFLRRLNVLQSVVSNLIAGQTGVWQKWDMTGPVDAHYANLSPLDEADVLRRVEWLAAHLDRCESILKERSQNDWLEIVYEHFYFAALTDQEKQLNDLWEFLGVAPLDVTQIEHYLRPADARLNSTETYALVPGIDRINDRCGSEETGWLWEQISGTS